MDVPIYVTQADTDHFGVNVGFVCHYNAAFANESAGPAAKSDREPASISLAEVAEVNAFNANVCLQWREQALGLKNFLGNYKTLTYNQPSILSDEKLILCFQETELSTVSSTRLPADKPVITLPLKLAPLLLVRGSPLLPECS